MAQLSHVFSSVEEYYHKHHFEAIDIVKGDLERRFMQNNFLIVQNMEKALLNSANPADFTVPQEVAGLYKNNFDLHKLNLHLQMLLDVIQSSSLNGI